jgi:hypothetical protein
MVPKRKPRGIGSFKMIPGLPRLVGDRLISQFPLNIRILKLTKFFSSMQITFMKTLCNQSSYLPEISLHASLKHAKNYQANSQSNHSM